MATKAFSTIQPSRGLYNKVRGGFIAQGSSLSRWCAHIGINVQNAQACLIGTWNGPRAKELRSELVNAAGIMQPFFRTEIHSTPDQAEATEAEEFFYWGC